MTIKKLEKRYLHSINLINIVKFGCMQSLTNNKNRIIACLVNSSCGKFIVGKLFMAKFRI